MIMSQSIILIKIKCMKYFYISISHNYDTNSVIICSNVLVQILLSTYIFAEI